MFCFIFSVNQEVSETVGRCSAIGTGGTSGIGVAQSRHNYLHPNDAASRARSSWSSGSLTSGGTSNRSLLAPIAPKAGSFDT